MKDIVLIHRNVRMFDNPALFHGSKNQDYGVIYLYDQNYWQANGKSEIQLNLFLRYFLVRCLSSNQQWHRNRQPKNNSLSIKRMAA